MSTWAAPRARSACWDRSGVLSGTFLSGFVLLSAFGVKTIFLGAGAVLLLLALLAFGLARKPLRSQAVPLVVALLAAATALPAEATTDPEVKFRSQSFYHRIEVLEHDTPAGWERHLETRFHLGGRHDGGRRSRARIPALLAAGAVE